MRRASLLAGCSRHEQNTTSVSPQTVEAHIARQLPAGTHDRQDWARDIYIAFSTQHSLLQKENLCAAIAVAGQESNLQR
ncbi:Protein of unknown function [Izhakiella capsodis]|uniref:Uncharacterized protein n=1 Tax=Izhakiella capsodis TaxID=1367852 RepID=A0A1I4UG39_9GAMM|nr:Protein of unknown function [Izhakiella capsodis]